MEPYEEEAKFEPVNSGHRRDLSGETQNNLRKTQSRYADDEQATAADYDESTRRELQRIATALSRRQTGGTAPSEADIVVPDFSSDPELDPASPSFNLSKWMQSFVQALKNENIQRTSSGVSYSNLSVTGTGDAIQMQHTVASFLAGPVMAVNHMLRGTPTPPKRILRKFDGLLNPGELLVVLGRPGSGCSTLLKTICGEMHGLQQGDESVISFNGVPQTRMVKEFKGEAIYNQEVDKHFPHLTVGQTLEFAAAVRTPAVRPHGLSRDEFCKYAAKVVMAACGLSHTYNTKVGNDFIRGVSGGERKRVSIAEMMLAGSPVSAWDNSTRGLDSATALKFVQSLRFAADFSGGTHLVAIYQASQAIYDLFDKAVVLYEGRQIYFGPANAAKDYFERMGWYCPPRQTVGDFLTSVTNPGERQTREGFENRVPRTADDFERYWLESPEYKNLMGQIDAYTQASPIDANGAGFKDMNEGKALRQMKHVRPGSPYIISMGMQIKLNTKRAYQRMWNDSASTITDMAIQLLMGLIVGSLFYDTPAATAGFFARGSALFQAILLAALSAISEITKLYDQRPIVEKHHSYAFYHPSTEAMAGIVADIPIKFLASVIFNIILYFMTNLHRSAGQFFIFFLVTFLMKFVMSAVFRTMAAVTKTVSQAMALAGILVLILVVYTGFVIPQPAMKDWFAWLRWINPIYYGFEVLISNEFHGHEYTCSSIIPSYSPPQGDSWICNIVGSRPGRRTVNGDDFIWINYRYKWAHTWRNIGIICAFMIVFMAIYFIASEVNSSTTSSAEVLVFPHGKVPSHMANGHNRAAQNEELAHSGSNSEKSAKGGHAGDTTAIEPQRDIFTWRDVVYDIEIKGEPRRLLDHVAGWVKPGTLTALMGVSGAGKTTLLDVLAQRTTMGVITGDMLVNGRPLDPSFQRQTGYVQQQDLHLDTATVRESLRFSADLRQPPSVSKKEKYDYVEEVIGMLNMEDFADAVVGVPGQGLNVEQRKLLTIGVELAAKPKLLLFLDEPTSGLDSQSSWAICAFLRKLADANQAVLCTVHQPSAILFQQFDRLLFLAKGGRTVYFGDIGENSRTMLDYFESHGARKCDDDENPAEFMLEIVNNGKNNQGVDWHDVWKGSNESSEVSTEIDRIHAEKMSEPVAETDHSATAHSEFAMPFWAQLVCCTTRVFQQYWRMPTYIFAKFFLATAAGLLIGFSFWKTDTSMAGMQNVMFSVFMMTVIFTTIVQQIQPQFVTQRSLYEVRERPSKAYSWKVFIISNVIVEIPFQVFTGILGWCTFYYPVVGIQSSIRQVLVLLFLIQLMVYASSFAQMTIAAIPNAETASGIVTLLTIMMLSFCGVLQTPDAMPGFWIFMYRVSPLTYWIGGIVSTMLHGRKVVCSEAEVSRFNPPSGMTCGTYLADYLADAIGVLQNPDATSDCRYCAYTLADQYLAPSKIKWSEKWRNYGIMWAFVIFNIFIAVVTYWMFRVRKSGGKSTKTKTKKPSAKKA
ncbi:ZEB2-regulated ABC transporter 1 [Ceratocystis fimbriata CBS 114723]|uniref:ZEB2-regulated ABC transporter 1 n=1 Tax=Ceratocystis fimbriata CBS 114723 TaxID=1035309 RepID=A0A2C5WYA4_9PEZI|nr:ZEB2-regulated ABC transporter 1 [Ceratocystis fimbriata CBS 114723]